MNPLPPAPLRAQLREILQGAGEIALSHFGGVRAVAKPDGTQVTVADREVEDWLVRALSQTFPGDAVVSEEGTRVEGGDATWYVDPIDGTSAYVEGLAHWGPTVCRVGPDGLDLGALWLPRLGEFWYARRGRGAKEEEEGAASGAAGRPAARANGGDGSRRALKAAARAGAGTRRCRPPPPRAACQCVCGIIRMAVGV